MHAFAFEKLNVPALVARWREVIQDENVPDFCELDEFGEIEVNPPPSFKHQQWVAAIGRRMETQLGGESGRYALATAIGVRFPDVCWAQNFSELARDGGSDPLTKMPPICVEVLSPGNRRKKIESTVAAYLTAGVEEVVLVELDGRVRWFDRSGERPNSQFDLTLDFSDLK